MLSKEFLRQICNKSPKIRQIKASDILAKPLNSKVLKAYTHKTTIIKRPLVFCRYKSKGKSDFSFSKKYGKNLVKIVANPATSKYKI